MYGHYYPEDTTALVQIAGLVAEKEQEERDNR